MENFEQIERYLLNQMTDLEREAIENKIANDPEFSTEIDIVRELVLAVESHGLKNKLAGRKIGDQSNNSTPIIGINESKKSFKKYILAAASIAAMFICGIWFMQSSDNKSEQLFADAFYADPGLPTPMSESNNYDFYDAMVDYKMEKYKLALGKWNKINTGIGMDTLSYYKGLAALNLKKMPQAIDDLMAVPETSSFSAKAKWYLVSIYIKNKDFSEAKSLMDQIPATTNPKYEDIKRFLETK